jgi:hypothetical protein
VKTSFLFLAALVVSSSLTAQTTHHHHHQATPTPTVARALPVDSPRVERAIPVTKPTVAVVPTPEPTSEIPAETPTRTDATSKSQGGGGFIWFLVITIAGVWIWRRWAQSQPPKSKLTPEAEGVRKLILSDLANTGTTHRYNLNAYVLNKGESALWSFTDVKYYKQGTHREWVGGSHGYNVRIMKGFWYRVGSSRGHSVSTTSIDYKGYGNLVITTRGFSFLSTSESVRLPFSKIIGIETYRDGFKLLTDYAKNPIHMFGHLPTEDVAFIRDAMDLATRSPRGDQLREAIENSRRNVQPVPEPTDEPKLLNGVFKRLPEESREESTD